MTFNRIAVYGHRGWASSEIVKALASSGAPLRVLHRPGSDTTSLPANIEVVEVDLADQTSLVENLRDIDIVICLVGHSGVPFQHHFVEAIPKTQVKLFVPSDLAARYDEQGNSVPVNRHKSEVERAARLAGIPITVILPGNFAEFALCTPTRPYVAAAYADIFASTPISRLQGRDLALSELRTTGNEIAEAFASKFNTAPTTKTESKEHIVQALDEAIKTGNPFALALYCRKIWATGEQAKMIGEDIWNVEGYSKETLSGLIVEGSLKPYRSMPGEVRDYFTNLFNQCEGSVLSALRYRKSEDRKRYIDYTTDIAD